LYVTGELELGICGEEVVEGGLREEEGGRGEFSGEMQRIWSGEKELFWCKVIVSCLLQFC
jgi:hypothetical protein